MYVVFCRIDHCIHIHWCIVMGLGHNDPWVESHMWPQQTWGQRSSRGQWPLVQVFGKKGQCIHILWCIFKSNITMIAKVCDRESRRDTWFENRLVKKGGGKRSTYRPFQFSGQKGKQTFYFFRPDNWKWYMDMAGKKGWGIWDAGSRRMFSLDSQSYQLVTHNHNKLKCSCSI